MDGEIHGGNGSAKIPKALDADRRSNREAAPNVFRRAVSTHAQVAAHQPAVYDHLPAENRHSGPLESDAFHESWRVIFEKLPEIVKRFYENLFERLPEAKVLFEGSEIEAQYKKLEGALRALKSSQEDIESMTPLLEALARRHTGYGVKASHLYIFRDCLLETFATVAGDAWTDQASAEWNMAFQKVINIMKNAMEDDSVR